ncbi:MAG: alkaline phosphatase family protein [Candidatus Hodarchaeota archaeon]
MSRNARVSYVILIILDDVRAEHLFNWMREGKLPNITKIAENGITCENCITSFPSVTLPCYADIITGSNSGYYPKEGSGVPNYHWINRLDPPSEKDKAPFIRNYSERRHLFKINKDIGTNVKTIFEHAGQGNFLSVTSFLYRGSIFTTSKEFKAQLILKRIIDLYRNPREIFPDNEIPKISIGYIPHTDQLMHEKGFDHPDYINLVLDCDKSIGLLVKALMDIGIYKDTAICIASDHGNYKAQKAYNLEPFFQEKGLRPYNPKNASGDFDANLGGVGFFNFKGDTWQHHPTINQMKSFKPSGTGSSSLDLLETLWELPGVKLMYYQNDNNTPEKGIIYLERRDNKSSKILKGRIEYHGTGKNQKTKYSFESEDLFNYVKNEESAALLNNKFHTIDEWVAATSQIDFINIIDQLPRHFKNPRSCDIIISTIGEYCFNYEHGKTKGTSLYSHDISQRSSMTVPLIIGGSPRIPKLELNYCKTTDIVPTLLGLLGSKPDQSVIGKSVLHYD